MFSLRNVALATGFALSMSGVAIAQQDLVRIGAIAPLSGPAANLGVSMKQAFEIVAKEANAAGGVEIDGKKRDISFLFEDSQGKPELGLAAAQKLLTRDNVDALFHSLVASSVALAVMELAPSFPDKLFLSGQNVSIQIARKIAAEPKKYANVWKPGWNSDAYAATVAGLLASLEKDGKVNLGGKTVAFIVEDTDYGASNQDDIQKLLAAAGWKAGGTEVVPVGNSDFYPQLAKLTASKPDVVVSVFTAANSGIALVKQMKERGLKALHVAVPYGNYTEFMAGSGPEKNGLLSVPLIYDPANNPSHRDFAERLKTELNVRISQDHALGYCIGNVMIDAMKRAKTLDFDKLNAAMAATDYKCMLGRWVFDPKTHSPMMGAEYLALPASQIQNGEHRAIWPATAATAAYQPQ